MSCRGGADLRYPLPGTAAADSLPAALAAHLDGDGRTLVIRSTDVTGPLRDLASGRAVAVGIGLPVILLVASKGSARGSHPDVAGYTVFGLTITTWTTYGVRLVAAREAGVLKRWRATPLPRWCYFAGAITATTVAAVLAGAVAIAAACSPPCSPFGGNPAGPPGAGPREPGSRGRKSGTRTRLRAPAATSGVGPGLYQ